MEHDSLFGPVQEQLRNAFSVRQCHGAKTAVHKGPKDLQVRIQHVNLDVLNGKR